MLLRYIYPADYLVIAEKIAGPSCPTCYIYVKPVVIGVSVWINSDIVPVKINPVVLEHVFFALFKFVFFRYTP